MFIKNIIISGFRSYREQSFPDGLSAGTNTIVGKNGSGKSNFFAAIQFVLNEKFSTLRPAERKDLFHVGSGRPSLSIFVEIVFDNSDGRLVIPGKSDEPEVRIRRTVGLKQDEFRVNDRKFSAAEVHQLLESAGFSSSNPYYIVEQGKIASMASMNEQDRYQLIKDVAGTKVYEIRRLESERILGETKVKHSQIDESIAQLNEKLKDLETESAELKEFHEADQEKKCIEYCIFTSDLRSTKQSLEKLDTEWKGRLSTLNDANNSSFDEEHELAAVSGALADLTTSIGTLEAQKESIQRELSALYQKQAVTELDVTHAAGSISRNEMEHTSLVKEQKHLEKAIGASRQALSNAESALRTSETRAAEIVSTTAQLTASLDKLQEKRNRTKLFKSKHERDAWISKEIDSNSEISEKASSEARTIDAERKHIQEAILLDEQKLHQMTSMTSKPEGALPLHESKISSCVSKRDSLNAERRRLWQAVHDQESLAQRLDDSASRAQQQLDRIVRQDIRIGLRSVREILQQRSDQLSNSVHGQLIELIKVEEGFESAADITAGNALFHVVVDSFDTSALLLNEMNRQKKPGRVSFFPLDTCKGTATRIPSTEECFPLVSKICCDQKFGGIISEVFGRTAVVTSMEAGARLVKELQCDVVTLDGDQLGRRGGITGGYIDRKNVKLSVHIREKKARAEAVAERAKLNLMYEQVATVEQQITQVLNELESLRSANESNEKEADSNLREIRAQEEYITRRKAQIESLDARKAHLLRAIDAANQQIGNMRKEKNEPFTVVWSAAEETNMEKLSEEVSQHRRRSAEAQAHTLQLATDLKLQEDALLHLERRHAAITDRIRELGWRTATSHSVNLDNEAIKKECSELSNRLNTAESKLESLLREKQKLELQAKTLNAGRLSSTIDNQERKEAIDTMQMQRNLLVQRRDEAQERLRKLGAVPTDITKYATFSLGKLMHNLKGVNDRLRKFMHVNRKALDQHASMLELKNDLQTQRESLNRELTSIHELMNHLDQKKGETIERTFKQIQYQFEEVFKELVGLEDCCAELQLLVRDEKTETDDPFWGTAIRVSFGLGTAVSDLDQLSGGQKSLVALALIFAIQRCDPAPFYLLDEIDAALDGEYRSAVAKVVQKQSRESQFIIASFKTEMLEVADKVFGIFFHNKVSRIQNISADEGTKLLKQAAMDDRKRSREGVA